MKIYCKWVSDGMTTMNDTHWKLGVANEIPKHDSLDLGYSGFYHYEKHPLLAVLLKNSHGCQDYAKLYEVLPEGKIVEESDRGGSTKLTLVKELEIPQVTEVQRIGFAILCAKEVYEESKFVYWADKWLSGQDRPLRDTYESAFSYAERIIEKARDDAAYSAFFACYNAARGYYSYDYDVIEHVLKSNPNIDLISIAKKAMEI